MSIGLIGQASYVCGGDNPLERHTHDTNWSEAELYHLFITDWPARQAGVGAGGDNNKQSS